jgi:translation initiation factor RLI1
MATKTDNLTPQQETAVDLLAFGATITDAAATVKVSRQTVSEWRNHHAGFQAVLNARRRELFAENQERLRSLVPKALETLEGSLGDERQAMATAVHILKAAGLYGLPEPSGSIHVDEIESAERTRQMLSAW